MGLAKQIVDSVTTALAALHDVAVTGQLIRRVAKAHVPGEDQKYTTTTFTITYIPGSYKHTEIDGTNVRSGDLRLTIFPFKGTPSVNDLIIIGGIEFRIKTFVPTYVGELIALYDVQVRPHGI